ncbi:MAG TPA: hypothetical protein RMH85_06890 [Polyangiaceae bacterium LLY-WYZ-15_(1-7)]|nr:hypothetical protein [Sandaracinus sp.]HJK92675.1 hypothetical protein [Polyangiaceae bacterium LLY-WYZ-15_(1-7)]HJL05903.1 hypothetical protein [Polyangiaceae bacterium LLY-WYZ-15_(1-7)]HJL08204.1 hypothetical protein [Polyangiaceae bacterium LLY-WYZ-15_(1-7)]HJL21037.1 hypothetical protein [Polyangiaceae bacterium LLY-WYZ-15_(1-7)]
MRTLGPLRSILLALPLLALACGGGDIGDECDSDGDCSSGLVCTPWPCLVPPCPASCEQPCEEDAECPDGRVCSGGLCAR